MTMDSRLDNDSDLPQLTLELLQCILDEMRNAPWFWVSRPVKRPPIPEVDPRRVRAALAAYPDDTRLGSYFR